ncbi:MAG: molecular chaperone DnaJ, partial [Gemmatimonadaceae bacterium]|nr:molecular chaperone DnaJ [Acetobacteraceae bacterium]
GASAVGAVVLLGPLAWSWWQQAQGRDGGRNGAPRTSKMGRAEALEVLDLQDPVSDADVRAAWVRLMRVAHPDGGGSHGLAARVNQARDVLLKGR